jgi:hypothetical protein
MATGLLVVATIASLTGSIGLAAIGAERDETANLPPAVMCIAVAVVVSIVSVLAAFEVLAAIYLPSARTLFSIITGVGGLAGAYFTSFTVGDCYRTGPRDPSVRPVWLARQWIQDQRSGYKHAQRLAILGAIPILMAMAVRVFVGHFEPTSASVNTLVGVGLLLSMAGIFLGVQRTAHAFTDEDQRGVRSYEAYGTSLAVALYSAALIVFLP